MSQAHVFDIKTRVSYRLVYLNKTHIYLLVNQTSKFVLTYHELEPFEPPKLQAFVKVSFFRSGIIHHSW